MATYKGVGFDNTNGRVRTGTSSDDISFDAQITATDGVAVTGEVSTTTLTTTGDASIGGDLTVTGDIISRGEVNLVVEDPFIDLGVGNTTDTADPSGFTFSLNRNTNFTAETITAATAGVDGVSAPTLTASASTSFAAGDLLVLTGSDNNNGIFVVNGVAGTTITLKGTGGTAIAGAVPFAQNQVETETGQTATAYKVDIKVLLVADGSSNFQDGESPANTFAKGTFLEIYVENAAESDFTSAGDYTEVGAGATTLQGAYDGGGDITTAGSADIAFTLTSGDFTVDSGSVNFGGTTALTAFNLDTSGAITVDSSGSGVSIDGAGASNFTTSSGALTLDGNGGVSIAGNAAEVDITTTGALDLNSAAFTLDASTASIDSTDTTNLTMTANVASAKVLTVQAVNSDGGGSAALTMLADDTVNINATGTASTVIGNSGSNDVTIDSAGAISVDAADASNFTVAGADLTLATTTSGEVDITSAGLMDLNAGANLDIDVTGTFDVLSTGAFSIDGTGSSNVTATSGNLTLETDTSGTLTLNSAGSVDINATNDATIDAGGTISLDGADNSNFTLAANDGADKTLTIAASNSGGGNGVLDIDADGAITIDAGGALSLDAGAASNLTTSAGALTLDGAAGVSIAGNAAEVDITTTGAVDVNSASFDLDASGDITLDTTNDSATAITLTANGGTSEKIVITNTQGTAQDAVSIVANAGSVQIAGEASDSSVSISAPFPQFSRNINANENLASGDVLYLLSGGSPAETRVAKTDADAASTSVFAGVALTGATSGNSEVVCVAGIAEVTCVDTFAQADIGKPVYLSTTAGQVSKTAPSGAGDIVFQVGICVAGSGTTWEILLQPQFIMEIG